MQKIQFIDYLPEGRFVVAADVAFELKDPENVNFTMKLAFRDSVDDLPCHPDIALQLYRNFIARIFKPKSYQRTTYLFRLPTFEWWTSPLSKNQYLSDVSPKDKPWDTHRAMSSVIAAIYQSSGFDRYSERLNNCSKLLEFALAANDEGFFYKLRAAHFCRHRHCTICQWRRTLMWAARIFKAMPKIIEDYPTHRYLMLTLTVRNCHIEELRDTISWMNKSWERLSKRKAFPGVGFIKSLEVTRKEDDGTAHPHFHVLLMVPSGYFGSSGGYLNHDKWMKIWRSCLRIQYDPTVDIRAIRPKSEQHLIGALRETLKYTTKPEHLIQDADWFIELTKQMHKTRAISLGGIFKKYLSESEPDDYITEEPSPDTEQVNDERFLFNWMEDVKRYARKIHSE